VSYGLNAGIEDPCKITDTANFCVKALVTEWVISQHIKRPRGQVHTETRIQAVIMSYVIYGKDFWNREARGSGLWPREQTEFDVLW